MNPTIRARQDSRPRFEYYSPGSATLRTVYVDKTPFVIGRGEATELQVASTSVSREHAKLVKGNAGYRLQDLGSTNGTQVNGQRITDAPLADGDSVEIADIELTFCCTSVSRLQRIVTQPLKKRPNAASVAPAANDVLLERSLSETLLWQTIPLREQRIVNGATDEPLAAVASIDAPLADQLRTRTDWGRFSVASRLQRLAWRMAAERADAAPTELLLRVENLEMELDLALKSFSDARLLLRQPRPMGLAIPWSEVGGANASLSSWLRCPREGLSMLIDGFKGGPQDIDALDNAPPDFLVLDPRFAKGCSVRARQLQQVEIVHSCCVAAGIIPVLPAGLARADHEACARFGLTNAMVSEGAASIAPSPVPA